MAASGIDYSERAKRDLERSIGKGLRAAAIYLKNRVKEAISVPAPRVRFVARDGTAYYRATTPATPGAPPRKLSGRLRASIEYEMDEDKLTARVGTSVVYGRVHEEGVHQFLMPTLVKEQSALMAIIGGSFSSGLETSGG